MNPDMPSSSSVRDSKKQTPDERQVELFAMAMLAVQGYSNAEIGKILHLTESKVRRLRTELNQQKLLTVDYSKADHPDIIERARLKAGQSEVQERLKHLRGSRLRFFQAVLSGKPADCPDKNLEAFAVGAASYLRWALTNARTTLVTFGRTLEICLQKIHFRGLDPDFAAYPACCDPYDYSHETWCSSALALSITQRQGHDTQHHPSLAGLLPIINPEHLVEARRALAKYMVSAPDYQRIYGPGGLAERANCLLTSIGRSIKPWTLGDDYFVKHIGISREELDTLIEAEIGGVPLPKQNLNPKQMARFRSIDEARLGLSWKIIEDIAQKPAGSSAPGVVVLAMGENKAQCLLELIRRGLVNMAIVDQGLEEKLRELL